MIVHPVLVVRHAVPILKNPLALCQCAFDGVVSGANHLLQLQPNVYLGVSFAKLLGAMLQLLLAHRGAQGL